MNRLTAQLVPTGNHTAHDRCEYSPMASCLNVEDGGDRFLAFAVAVRDCSFSKLATERDGLLEQDRKVLPRSVRYPGQRQVAVG